MKTLIVILTLLLSTTAWADVYQLPLDCYPQEISETFAKHGYKVELNSERRDRNSWAFIRNNGSKYEIVTYRSLSPEEMQEMIQIIWEVEGV